MIDFLPVSSGKLESTTNLAASMFIGVDLIETKGANPKIVVTDQAGSGVILFQHENSANTTTVELSYPIGTMNPPIQIALTNTNAIVRYK